MSNLRILVAGGGIAGPTTAYWLAKAGATVTVVERAPSLRTAGQQIDVRGAAWKIMHKMGLEEVIKAKTTEEQGLAFVASDGSVIGEFPVGEGKGFSSTVEIIRGDLATILFEAAKDVGVEFMFGDYVSAAKDVADKVQITFGNKQTTEEFDLFIIADGLGSRTRSNVFGEMAQNAVRSLNQYAAYYTIPYSGPDGTWSRWYNATGGRLILLRPDNDGTTRCWLSVMSKETAKMQKLVRSSIEEQKAFLRVTFADAGFEAERVLKGMNSSDDFYMDQIGQVKMPSWSSGRSVLVGDAGYCPSPISGMGTSVAITGSYILAGEIAKHPTDFRAAFAGYEEVLRPFVDKAQKLPPGAPAMANPQTKWGIWALNTFIGWVSWSGVYGWMGKYADIPADGITLPEYVF